MRVERLLYSTPTSIATQSGPSVHPSVMDARIGWMSDRDASEPHDEGGREPHVHDERTPHSTWYDPKLHTAAHSCYARNDSAIVELMQLTLSRVPPRVARARERCLARHVRRPSRRPVARAEDRSGACCTVPCPTRHTPWLDDCPRAKLRSKQAD